MKLKDKTAIVTGGSRGIGAAIVVPMLKRGQSLLWLTKTMQSKE